MRRPLDYTLCNFCFSPHVYEVRAIGSCLNHKTWINFFKTQHTVYLMSYEAQVLIRI